jgi:hypothetical protein
MRPFGYYVHHQGAGHWQRARRIAALSARPCTLLGTFAGMDVSSACGPVVELPDDRMATHFDGRDGVEDRPQGLHYAPLGHPGIRSRMARIARWVEETDPVLLVVDLSVEVTLFARLLSLPTLVFRLPGLRTDPPHLEAFRAAERIIAPFPEALEDAETPAWVRAKTFYAGLLAEPGPATGPRGRDVVVLLGRGGGGPAMSDLAAAARAVPDRHWHVLGEPGKAAGDVPQNLTLHGWVDDVPARLARAALVVGAAGDGVLAAAAMSGAPLICLPEPRPHDEQTRKAASLARLGAAIVHDGWPAPASWPGLMERALALDPSRLSALATPDAMARLAGEIEMIAGRIEERPRPGLG